MKKIAYIVLGGTVMIFLAGVLLGGDTEKDAANADIEIDMSRCEDVPENVAALIRAAVEGREITNLRAVRSSESDKVEGFEIYFVAGIVEESGETAVWASAFPVGTPLYSANDTAYEVSGFGYSDDLAMGDAGKLSMNSDGAAEAEACLEA